MDDTRHIKHLRTDIHCYKNFEVLDCISYVNTSDDCFQIFV